MGRSRKDLGIGLRSFSFKRFIIFYRLLEDGIEIFRILHGKQNVEDIFPE
jgi:toxin ParE1/3/4